MPLAELRREVARRLRELRESRLHGISPEDVAVHAREKGLAIGAQTIREWEHAEKCNPTMDKLHELLALYGSTLGDLFRFTSNAEDSWLVGDLLNTTADKELKHAVSVILSRVKPQKS
jgi:hypothetical protein